MTFNLLFTAFHKCNIHSLLKNIFKLYKWTNWNLRFQKMSSFLFNFTYFCLVIYKISLKLYAHICSWNFDNYKIYCNLWALLFFCRYSVPYRITGFFFPTIVSQESHGMYACACLYHTYVQAHVRENPLSQKLLLETT